MVSLPAFAALVPMPESTARRWLAAGHITARRTVTGRTRVNTDQLPAVRRMLALDDATESRP